MNQMTLIVYLTDAPAVIAALVREGVTFEATQIEDKIRINFTGGY